MGAVLKVAGFIGGQRRQIYNTLVRTSAAFIPMGWEGRNYNAPMNPQ